MVATNAGSLGASVVSFALAAYFGYQVRSINNELDPDRRFACPVGTMLPVGYMKCGVNGQPAPRDPWHGVPLGEILLGHLNAHAEDAPGPLVPLAGVIRSQLPPVKVLTDTL